MSASSELGLLPPTQTPACRGLGTLKFARSGQARSRLGEGWGGGEYALKMPPPYPSPASQRGRTEYAARACFKHDVHALNMTTYLAGNYFFAAGDRWRLASSRNGSNVGL